MTTWTFGFKVYFDFLTIRRRMVQHGKLYGNLYLESALPNL